MKADIKYVPIGVVELAECGSLDAKREIRRLKKLGFKMPPALWPLPPAPKEETKDHLCLGNCGAIASHKVMTIAGYLKCIKCRSGVCWIGDDLESRLKTEPALLNAMRRKYGR